MKTETRSITYRGFPLEVSFTYDKGFKGSQVEPPEPPSIDIEDVTLEVHCSESHFPLNHEVDITDLLDASQLKEIEEILWEVREADQEDEA